MWGWSFRESAQPHHDSETDELSSVEDGVRVITDGGGRAVDKECVRATPIDAAHHDVQRDECQGHIDGALPALRTYHINTVTFVRPELEATGWRPARRGAVADFAMWTEQRVYSLTDHSRGASAKSLAERKMRRARRELYPRASLDAIDDKALLAKYFRSHGLNDGDGVPTTYVSVEELKADSTLWDQLGPLNHSDGHDDHTDGHDNARTRGHVSLHGEECGSGHGIGSGDTPIQTALPTTVCKGDHDNGHGADGKGHLLFLKLAAVDAALGVWCFASPSEVVDAVAERGLKSGTYVIQREVTNPRLREGHKCSVRSYVVVWNGSLWLWREFLFKVHASPYTAAPASDEAAHIHCRGAGPGVMALRGSTLPTYSADMAEMQRLVGCKLGPWAAALDRPPPWADGRYAIIGMDFIFNADGRAHIIEANCSPCMYDTAPGTNAIKRELAQAFCHTFVLPSADGLPHTAKESGEFVECVYTRGM